MTQNEGVVQPLPICCFDAEASAYPLPGSYPIEIAVADVDSGDCKAWLIKPTERWLKVGYWDPVAAKVHGITLEVLLTEGRAVEDVQRELADAVKGRRVVSDAVTADTYWLGVLHELSPLPFRIERLADFLRPATGLAGMAAREKVVAAMEEARRRYPREHRAEPDARRWAETFRILMGLA